MLWKIFLIVFWLGTGDAFMGSDRVRLRDLSAITLNQGQMTTGRRRSPVPQLKCVGGSAAHSFTPQTVQCRNVGFDGYDVQWECKADMDDSYRFGDIQVSCEGYDFPEDEYILKGSCGLEYKLEYTDAGWARQNSGSSNYVSRGQQRSRPSVYCFIFFIVVVAMIFLIYKKCSKSNNTSQNRNQQSHSGNHDTHSSNTPPPYGFKPEYTQEEPDHCPPPTYEDATTAGSCSSTNTASPVEKFWVCERIKRAAEWLFGGRCNSSCRGHSWCGNRGWGSSWRSGCGSNSWRSRSTTPSRSGWSTGSSRTASGFGGTKRR